jgi:hypothetical protein
VLRHSVFLLAILIVAQPAAAQSRQNSSWLGAQLLYPAEEAGDRYDDGFAITGSSRWVRTARFDWLLETGWFHLPGQDRPVDDIESVDALAVLFGGLLDYGVLQLGMKGGYYFLDLHEWDGVPTAQITFRRLAIGAEYKAFGTAKWGALFAKWQW